LIAATLQSYLTGIKQVCGGGSEKAAVEVAADTAQSLSQLTGVTTAQTNNYWYSVYF